LHVYYLLRDANNTRFSATLPDGKFISIAPPQSYLNINSTRFSRFVNLTDPTRRCEPYSTFSYYGMNVYAYLVHRYGDWIDLISIQFYESYSQAAYAINQDGMNGSDYLYLFVESLLASNQSFFVNFAEDTELELRSQNVSLPLQKLVFGLGNGWAGRDNKTIFISSNQLNETWHRLNSKAQSHVPRGFMFWTIDLEGENDIYMAKDLYQILYP
jgi:hypothetical protein